MKQFLKDSAKLFVAFAITVWVASNIFSSTGKYIYGSDDEVYPHGGDEIDYTGVERTWGKIENNNSSDTLYYYNELKKYIWATDISTSGRKELLIPIRDLNHWQYVEDLSLSRTKIIGNYLHLSNPYLRRLTVYNNYNETFTLALNTPFLADLDISQSAGIDTLIIAEKTPYLKTLEIEGIGKDFQTPPDFWQNLEHLKRMKLSFRVDGMADSVYAKIKEGYFTNLEELYIETPNKVDSVERSEEGFIAAFPQVEKYGFTFID